MRIKRKSVKSGKGTPNPVPHNLRDFMKREKIIMNMYIELRCQQFEN